MICTSDTARMQRGCVQHGRCCPVVGWWCIDVIIAVQSSFPYLPIVSNLENDPCIQTVIQIATKFNQLFIGPLPTYPENFMQIGLEVFAESCWQTDRQIAIKTYPPWRRYLRITGMYTTVGEPFQEMLVLANCLHLYWSSAVEKFVTKYSCCKSLVAALHLFIASWSCTQCFITHPRFIQISCFMWISIECRPI